jgi:hypothetical protein
VNVVAIQVVATLVFKLLSVKYSHRAISATSERWKQNAKRAENTYSRAIELI